MTLLPHNSSRSISPECFMFCDSAAQVRRKHTRRLLPPAGWLPGRCKLGETREMALYPC